MHLLEVMSHICYELGMEMSHIRRMGAFLQGAFSPGISSPFACMQLCKIVTSLAVVSLWYIGLVKSHEYEATRLGVGTKTRNCNAWQWTKSK